MPAIIAPLILVFAFFRQFWELVRKPRYRSLFLWFLLTLAAGTFFYSNFEGWSLVDSLYFSVVTLATVGYGDLVPTTEIGKIFTVIYILFGLSMLTTFVHAIANERSQIIAARRGEDAGTFDPAGDSTV